MAYKLVFKSTPMKRLRRMQTKIAAAITAALKAIAVDPFAKHAEVRAIKGTKDAFRLRHGDWRASYQLDRKDKTMTVFEVEPRGGAYRKK